ncbi:esterase FE4-like isoform X3 [Leptopilina boulardi]|uniref:esterase FE4-like isoform X3 n=1 Tax=Leptopilina boulardi TaxID=63433 RepID=UPI0021F507F7|nr:esterase FE4-like isoform X3 [Leptopilina boulardi]
MKKTILKSLYILFIQMLSILLAEEKPITIELNTPLGRIKGSFMTTRLERNIYSFRGMRYAEPPVGRRRFKQAEPVKPWKGIFDASVEGPACPQPGNSSDISEDCLRLNVYTNQLPTSLNAVKKPVIVYFHPGAFYAGSAQSNFPGPQYLLDKEVVLVTVNYRLASLGFISTGDSLLPGNLGLKDQVAALRWVKKYIAAFGGNPDCVTITGYSAGGWSVTLHLVSPMSRGLFHRVIAMSGSAVFQEPFPKHQKHLAIKQAQLLHCPTDNVQNILNCLNTKSAEEIANTLDEFFEWYDNPIWIWTPVIEPIVPGVERFLTDDPAKLIREGKFEQVPFIAGVTRDEIIDIIILAKEEAKKGNSSMFNDLNTKWEEIAPIIFVYERNTTKSRQISKELKSFYIHDEPITVNNLQGIAGIYRDSLISYSVHRLINLLSASSCKPVYYYHFIYQGRFSHDLDPDTNKPYGVTHHDDLMYIFYIKQFPLFKKDDPETRIVERMTAIWENFAKTGKPIPRDNELFENVSWKKFTPQCKRHLEIGNELVMRNGLINPKEMALWDKLFPLP